MLSSDVVLISNLRWYSCPAAAEPDRFPSFQALGAMSLTFSLAPAESAAHQARAAALATSVRDELWLLHALARSR